MRAAGRIIQRARQSGNPVIEGDRAVFIWEGDEAPHLISDLGGWDERPKPFRRLAATPGPDSGKPVWYCSLTLPRDAYLEYAFRDPRTGRKFLDPLNRRQVDNGVGGRNNFFYMPEAVPSPLAVRRAGVPAGSLTRHRVEAKWLRDDHEREIYLYRPPVKGAAPLLVVYDGRDYLRRAQLVTIVDNLIAEKRIQPIAMAFLPNGGRWRSVEYACSDATLLWLDEIVLPLARKRLSLLDPGEQPGMYGVLGASLGGTMALYTGLRMPEVFGRVICQSGAFTVGHLHFAAVDLVRHGQARGIKIWMDVGRLDDLLEDNRRMYALLKDQGYRVACREFSGGHNYTAWRDDLGHGLEALFGK